jgi:hypothetical protein
MKDRYIVAIIAAVVVALIAAFYLLLDRRPLRWRGVPASGITCGYEDNGVSTCVGDGKVFTCVTNWRSRVVACAPAPAVRP